MKHKQGCPSLGGYGHGVGACECGAAAQADTPTPRVDAAELLRYSPRIETKITNWPAGNSWIDFRVSKNGAWVKYSDIAITYAELRTALEAEIRNKKEFERDWLEACDALEKKNSTICLWEEVAVETDPFEHAKWIDKQEAKLVELRTALEAERKAREEAAEQRNISWNEWKGWMQRAEAAEARVRELEWKNV